MTPTAPSDPAWGTRTGRLPRSTPPTSPLRTPALHRPDERLDRLVDAAEAGVEVCVREAVRIREHWPRRAAPQPEQGDLCPGMGPPQRARLVRLHGDEEISGGGPDLVGPAGGAGEQLDATAPGREHRRGVRRGTPVRAQPEGARL